MLRIDSRYALFILSNIMMQQKERKIGPTQNLRYKKFFFGLTVLLFTFIVFYLDLATGSVIDFNIFYFPSIIIATWYFGNRFGFLITLLVTSMWAAGQWDRESSPDISIFAWDSIFHLLTFTLIFFMTNLILKKSDQAEGISQELARSNNELAVFAFRAAHDLQSPLATILGYTELLDEKYRVSTDEESKDFIDKILKNIERMKVFIKSLLDYAKVMKKETLVSYADLFKTVKEIISGLDAVISEKKAEITFNELPVVAMNPGLASLLFQNLISNALKYCEKPPRVHIAAVLNGKEWVFSVKDNGIGISFEDLERIFIMFEKLSTRKQYAGSGIGLATCQKIVMRYGGRIWAESKPDEGSTFYFTLPAS